MTARGLAINVAANTGMPGFRGPITEGGRFEYVPIPEREPTREPVPTYGDLELAMTDVAAVADEPVHLDPEFPTYPHGERYTYGDEHGVKARPIAELGAGDHLFFYATLSTVGEASGDPVVADWGAYLIAQFRLAADPITPSCRDAVPEAFANNAHVKRETFDARVLVQGAEIGSRLYDRAVPLSRPEGGTSPNELVTEWSDDSGEGPWWRRPIRFDGEGVDAVLEAVAEVEETA